MSTDANWLCFRRPSDATLLLAWATGSTIAHMHAASSGSCPTQLSVPLICMPLTYVPLPPVPQRYHPEDWRLAKVEGNVSSDEEGSIGGSSIEWETDSEPKGRLTARRRAASRQVGCHVAALHQLLLQI